MTNATNAASPWLVACLCAGWCRTCDGYQAVMAKAREAHPSLRFAWVDIEDHADALDDPDNAAADIESFPTILLVHADTPHFFGTVLPHAAVLDRLILQALAGELPPVVAPAARRLAVAVARLALNEPEATRIA